MSSRSRKDRRRAKKADAYAPSKPVPEWFAHSFARRESLLLAKSILQIHLKASDAGDRVAELFAQRKLYYNAVKAETSYREDDHGVYLRIVFPDNTLLKITIPFVGDQGKGIIIQSAYRNEKGEYNVPSAVQ